MYFLLALPFSFILFGIIIGFIISGPVFKGKKSVSFNGRQFKNYDNIKAKGLFDVLKWAANRNKGEWKEIHENPTTIPEPTEKELTAYFINHATFLIQWENLNILTDPIWSERTSPFSFAGPKRKRPPGIAFHKLPQIHYVLLSHNHYDHLDLPTLKRLWKRDKPKIIVPLGVELYLKLKNIDTVASLDWWEKYSGENFEIELVPSQHFSGRGMLDRDKTLWGGYIITNNEKKVYFMGDTGYNERMFDDIKNKHPKIDLAMIPIGAYKPRWFMSPIHISPEEAVHIHKKMNIKKSVAMHYGTFPLADDNQNDAPLELKKALKENNIPEKDFILLEEGNKV